MNNDMKNNQHKGWKALSVMFFMSLAFAGTAALTACSSDDDPFFTASADDAPRILNTDLTNKTIDRTTPLQMEVKVTPMQYTTVTWLLNGVQIAEGFAIDQLIPVGDHSLKILATTVKGKSTYRTIRVSVMPLEGDPVLAGDAKSRWLTVGATKTISCENVTGVSGVFIGEYEATDVSYAKKKLTFTVPAMPEGDYLLDIVDADGVRYGCGVFTVSNDDYVSPPVTETTLWEGDVTIDWDDKLCRITAQEMADVPVGATIYVYHDMVEATYHAMRITTPQWGQKPEDDLVTQFDITADTPIPFTFTYDEHCKSLVDTRGAMCVVGFGYKVTKITYGNE